MLLRLTQFVHLLVMAGCCCRGIAVIAAQSTPAAETARSTPRNLAEVVRDLPEYMRILGMVRTVVS